MTDKERDELKEVIRKDYPGISEAEISFMISFFEMMRAKTAAYPAANSGETAATNTKNIQGTGNAGESKGWKNPRLTGWWTQANHLRHNHMRFHRRMSCQGVQEDKSAVKSLPRKDTGHKEFGAGQLRWDWMVRGLQNECQGLGPEERREA